MPKRLIPYAIILLIGYAYIVEAATCKIIDQVTWCRYTVLCETYAGSAQGLRCDHEANVTFQFTNSNLATLSKSTFGSTNFDDKVRYFIAKNNTWRSIAANAFSYYGKTLEFDISNNEIKEIQNEAFKNLYSLTHLNISHNYIDTLYSKSLLMTELKEPTVQILDLSNNMLSRIAIDTFYQCRHLQELYLQNNRISNLDDAVFNSLQNLTRLFLQNNEINDLNMTLINLKRLKELDLSHNAMTKLMGYETNRLTSLERLNISFNEIEFIESNCFNQAFNLESLDLRNNRIKSTITNIIFVNNRKLNYLNLYNNNISLIQENAFQHNTLLYINLEKNFISGEIKETTFVGLQRVKKLNLSKQNVTNINAKAFKDMTCLINLNLSFNNIEVIDVSSFINASELTVLDLSHNKITNLTFLKDVLINLTEIYLNHNKILLIPAYTFINQTKLKKIDISMNKIITIEQYSLPLNNLQFLNVSGNFFTGAIKNNVLSPGKYIRYLDLSSLNITRIEDMAFIDLPLLARLNLSHNAIEYIGKKNFLNFTNMFSLDLSYNQLSTLHLNSTFMKSLNALYLNNNNLKNLKEILPNSTEILYLDISSNNISELISPTFERSRALRVLLASNNKIKIFNNPQINLLSKLVDIDLSSNQISEIDLKFYKRLVRLDISNNNLNNINSSSLQHLDQLQVLNISNNNISTLYPGAFLNAKHLKILNISSNSLSNLRHGSFMDLDSVEVIDISRNNIKKFDIEVFHECIELRRLIIDYNQLQNLNIEHIISMMPKLKILSIGGNPLHCTEIIRNIKNINKTNDRSVEITSIHKIFHEDNVYGIRCGDMDLNTTETPTSSEIVPESANSSALVVWCSILTVVLVLLPAAFFIWKHYKGPISQYSQSRIQLRRSVELSGSDFQSDLMN